MSKRRADKQLTLDNFNDESEPQQSQEQQSGAGLKLASDDVCKTRKILTGRRRLGGGAGDESKSKPLFSGLSSLKTDNSKISTSNAFSGFNFITPSKPSNTWNLPNPQTSNLFSSINFGAPKTETAKPSFLEAKAETESSTVGTSPQKTFPKFTFGSSTTQTKSVLSDKIDDKQELSLKGSSERTLFSQSPPKFSFGSDSNFKLKDSSSVDQSIPDQVPQNLAQNSNIKTFVTSQTIPLNNVITTDSSEDSLHFYGNVQQLNSDFQKSIQSSLFCDNSRPCLEYLVYMRRLRKQKELGKKIICKDIEVAAQLAQLMNTRIDQLLGLIPNETEQTVSSLKKVEDNNTDNKDEKKDEISTNVSALKKSESITVIANSKETPVSSIFSTSTLPKIIETSTDKAPIKSITSNLSTAEASTINSAPSSVFCFGDNNAIKPTTLFGSSNSSMPKTFFNFSTPSKSTTNETDKVEKKPEMASSLPASKAAAAFTFGGPSFTFGSTGAAKQTTIQGGEPFKILATTFKSIENVPNKEQTQDAETEENESPPKVEAVEHEEESSVYTKKIKLYFKQEEKFVDKGLGFLYINKKDGHKPQLLIRSATVTGSILLNIHLSTALPVKVVEKGVMITCLPNSSSAEKDDKELVTFLVRVKTSNDAQEVYEKFVEHRSD